MDAPWFLRRWRPAEIRWRRRSLRAGLSEDTVRFLLYPPWRSKDVTVITGFKGFLNGHDDDLWNRALKSLQAGQLAEPSPWV